MKENRFQLRKALKSIVRFCRFRYCSYDGDLVRYSSRKHQPQVILKLTRRDVIVSSYVRTLLMPMSCLSPIKEMYIKGGGRGLVARALNLQSGGWVQTLLSATPLPACNPKVPGSSPPPCH